MHRIFCATPWEMENERNRFHDAVGQFNELHATAKGILYIPVSLVNIRDKRPLQYMVDENIEDCRHFVLLLAEDWGPVERDFENDYHLALKCLSDPARPMRDVAILRRLPHSGRPLAAGMPAPDASFSTMPEFEQNVNGLLAKWLGALTTEQDAPGERHATA